MKRAVISMFAAAAAASALSGPALAAAPAERGAYQTGHEIWDSCRGRWADDYPLDCIRYVTGVLDGLRLGGRPATTSCIPPAVAPQTLAGVAYRFMDERPARRGEPAASLVTEALAATYPCPAGAPR